MTSGSSKLLSTITFPEGNTVSLVYDTQQRLTGYTNGTITLGVSYDPTQGTVITSAQGSTTYHHDTSYRVDNITDAYSKTITPGWFSAQEVLANPGLINLPKTITDNRTGTPLSYAHTYDTKGNVLTITDPLGGVKTFTYDDKNNLTSVTDPDSYGTNYKTVYAYDNNEINLIGITRPMGGATSYTYDSKGLVQSSTDSNGHVLTYSYNAYGNLIGIQDTALGTHVDLTYDAAGRLLSKTDQLGRTTSYTYDANDNFFSIADPSGHPATYTYNKNNKPINLLDTRAKLTSYTYNPMDLLSSETDPILKMYQYTYDSRGNLSTITDPDALSTAYTYDYNGKLISVQYNGESKITLVYNSDGTINKANNENGDSSFTYDALKRVAGYTNSLVGKNVSYSYYLSGNLKTITYPNGQQVQYDYNRDSQLIKVTDWLGGVTSYVYDSSGILKFVTNANGTTAIYSYDGANRLIGLSNKTSGGSTLASYSYTLDAFGNHTQVNRSEPLNFVSTASSTPYTYDDANRLISAGGVSYTYDNRGNLTGSSNGSSYNFDWADRLAQAVAGGKNIQYSYDALGNRIARSEGGVTTRYVLDLRGSMSRVLAETNGTGTETGYYIYGLGLISKITPDNKRYTYHYDSRGSTVAITDSSQQVVNSYAYDEYGKVMANQELYSNPFRYVGQFGVMDEENGLLFMRARYYDTDTGRFLNKDPLGFGGGDLNLYGYVRGNPVMGTDPEGLILFAVIMPYIPLTAEEFKAEENERKRWEAESREWLRRWEKRRLLQHMLQLQREAADIDQKRIWLGD